ncbi:uncharacterized protein [Henckelia pumila]|uniref:uncharacterized protein n=1 Tax=Henckelia pumila TaxID=405737 RepID=UPI003C6E90F5
MSRRPGRPATRQTGTTPLPEQAIVALTVPRATKIPRTEQGSTSADLMNATATPMETLLKRFQSFNPPTLKGTENSIECESWLENMEMLFDSLDYIDERRVRLIGHQLHEVAKSWWFTTKRALEHRGTVITWNVFKTEFFQRFFPGSYRKDKGAEFANLKQENLNIEEYVAKFSTFLRFAPHVAKNDEVMADQFINGLNPEVFTLVNSGRPKTFADALDRAKGAETGLIKQRGASYVAQPQRQPQPPAQFQQPPPRFESGGSRSGKKGYLQAPEKQFKKPGSSSSSSSGSKPKSGVYCSSCGGGHPTDQCRCVFGSCHICHQTGHFARVCPQRGSGRSKGVESSRAGTQPERQASSVHSFQPPLAQQPIRPGGSQTVSQPPRQQARVFALTKEQAQGAPDDVIAGNCYLCCYPVYVLIDTGASHTLIFERFALLHALPVESLPAIASVSSPLGRSLISVNTKGAEGFLVYAVVVLKTSPKLADLPVVSEFSDVFPDEILGLPPYRKIDFSIELMSEHLRTVLKTLRAEKLYAKLSKCEFWLKQVVFFGHIIFGDGISVDPSKVEAVICWPQSKSVPEILFETDCQPLGLYQIQIEPELLVKIKDAQKLDPNVQN